MSTCRLCPGLEQLAATHHCQRVAIQGWREKSGDMRWIVDLVDEQVAGHGNATNLEEAIDIAIREAVYHEPIKVPHSRFLSSADRTADDPAERVGGCGQLVEVDGSD